jgi:hypothetical protein
MAGPLPASPDCARLLQLTTGKLGGANPALRRCRCGGAGAWLIGLLLPLVCNEAPAPAVPDARSLCPIAVGSVLLRLRGGGLPLAGFTPGGMLERGRQRRLARAALRSKYGTQKTPRPPARNRAAVPLGAAEPLGERSREQPRRVVGRRAGGKRASAERDSPLHANLSTPWACDVMKALDGGCSDAQLQALLTKVHENGGYSDEEWDGQYREWPPEPEFAQDSETGQPLEEHSQVQRLAALAQQTAAAGLGDDADMEEGDNLAGQVPRGFLELQLDAVDSEDTLSTYTEDSKSDDDYVTPPTPPMQDKPIPGCTMLVHSSPDPAKRVPEEEGGVQESESSSEVNSSEQERRVRRQQHHVEYTADGLLAADAQFQEKMRRWRAGLPNFERPAPTTSPSFDSEQDDRYDFVGSHDEAAEPFSSAEGTALGQCFRSVCPALSRALTLSGLPRI